MTNRPFDHDTLVDISLALQALNLKYESLASDFKEMVAEQKEVNEFITGGNEPSSGAIVRLDRLEQDHKRKQLWYKAAIGASITACFGFVGMLVKMVYK